MIKLVVLDLDGTFYGIGDSARAGAMEFIENCDGRGINSLSLTNTTSKTRERVVAKIRRCGYCVDTKSVLTGLDAFEVFFSREVPRKARVLINHESRCLEEKLRLMGHEVLDPSRTDLVDIDFYIQGSNKGFGYGDLVLAVKAILRHGARFLATDKERFYLTKDGTMLPATGWAVSAIARTSGVEPLVVGKPNPGLLRTTITRMGLDATEVLIIGDSLEADIQLGQALGCSTCLMLGGVTSADAVITSEAKPDYVVSNFYEAATVVSCLR